MQKSFYIHKVIKNETLYSISKEYDVTVNDIIDHNLLTNTIIYPGEKLVIPVYNKVYKQYLTKNESIKDIIKNNNIDLDLFIKYNNLEELILTEKQIVNIPIVNKFYEIKEEDNVDEILNKFGKDARSLLILNQSEWLKKGNMIKL